MNARAQSWLVHVLEGRWLRIASLILLVTAGALAQVAAQQQPAGRVAVLLDIDGAIGPAASDYLTRNFDRAAERDAALVILRMNTPGGLDTSMREIIRAVLAAQVPVVTYVSPAGARAASAGTYILYASHLAAMTPGTNLGAATPIAIGGGGLPFGGQDEDEQSENGQDSERPASAPQSAAEAKAINDAVAYIRGLAELRGRNADWAEEAVREAASLTATAAAREGVIDFTANNLDDLLAKAHGMTVRVLQADVELDTAGLTIEAVEQDWRTRLLGVVTNPNVALILMMVGIYGLIFEFMNPGSLVPGTIGAISLLIGLYALAVLPVSYAGAALMLLGLALIVAEAFAPSFGILGLGGAAALVLGAAILFDGDVPGIEVSLPLLAAIGIAAFALSLLVARLALTSRKARIASGHEMLAGMEAELLDWSAGRGHVWLQGERWSAVGPTELRDRERVRVKSVDGLTLHVEPLDGQEPPAAPGT